MADPNLQYDPVEGWNNETEFPTNPPNRPAARNMFQRLFTQIQTFINTTLIAWVNDTFDTKINITTNRKLSETGDFTGTINGLQPIQVDPYVSATVAEHTSQLSEIAINVKQYGAKGDGINDDTNAINNAIASAQGKTVYLPAGTYKTTAPIVIPNIDGFILYGAGSHLTRIDPYFVGNIFTMSSGRYNQEIHDILIQPSNVLYQGVSTGIYITKAQEVMIKKVKMVFMLNGILLDDDVFDGHFEDIVIHKWSGKGVYILSSTGSCNANTFNRISLNNYNVLNASAYGIYIVLGTSNVFENCDISYCGTIYYQQAGNRNYFTKSYVEENNVCIDIESGSMIVDVYGAITNIINNNAVIFSPTGQASPKQDLTTLNLQETNGLKALYLFNEGTGSRVLDKSGNGKHATLVGTPSWLDTGSWGKGAYFCNTTNLITVPNNVVDFTQPYTFFYNYCSTGADTGQYSKPGLHLENGTSYFTAMANWDTLQCMQYTSVLEQTPSMANLRYLTNTRNNIWCFLYVDPINKTVEWLDPFGRSDALLQLTNAFAVTSPTTVYISGRHQAGNVLQGIMCLAGFYQRKLSLKEINSIVNNNYKPFSSFDKKVQLNTTLVSPNGTSFNITVSDAGAIVVT